MTTAQLTRTEETAKKLVNYIREGHYLEAIDALYDQTITNIEPIPPEKEGAVVKGFDAVREHNSHWQENHDFHSQHVHDPYINNNQFVVYIECDVTEKSSGKRMTLKEKALYTVNGEGKIIEARFFNPCE